MANFGRLFNSAEELLEPVEATVKGTLPPWLKGTLVRLGPGKFDLREDFILNHWLDGYAILYKFEIADGKVKFSKKFLQSEAYKRAVCVGRPVFTEFGTRCFPDPCRNIFSRMMTSLTPEMTDNNAINIFTLEDVVYVTSETNFMHRVDVESLDTCEKVDMSKIVSVNLASSHPCTDQEGTCYTMGTTLYTGLRYHVIAIPPSLPSTERQDPLQNASIIATIPSSWTTMMSYYHSFGLTQNHVVFIEQPLLMNGMKLLSSLVKGKSLRDCLDWRPNEKNKFIVVNKNTGKIVPVKYKSEEAFFLFHHINAYEEDGQIFVDVVAFDSPEILDKMFLKKLRRSEFDPKHPGGGRRYILPLPREKEALEENTNLVKNGSGATAVLRGNTVYLRPQILSAPGYDLPSINKKYACMKYRYYYAVGMFDPGPFNNQVVKVDTETGEVLTWRQCENTYAGEVQFVPHPEPTSEDHGLLLTSVSDARVDGNDFLLVLDARTLEEVARAEVKVQIPFVLHGVFV